MLTLRDGIKDCGKPLSADRLDEVRALVENNPIDEVDPAALDLLELIRDTARRLVMTGLHVQLDLAELSGFEVDCIAAAVADRERENRETLAGLIGLAIAHPGFAWEMVKGDETFERDKWLAKIAREASGALAGAGLDGGG